MMPLSIMVLGSMDVANFSYFMPISYLNSSLTSKICHHCPSEAVICLRTHTGIWMNFQSTPLKCCCFNQIIQLISFQENSFQKSPWYQTSFILFHTSMSFAASWLPLCRHHHKGWLRAQCDPRGGRAVLLAESSGPYGPYAHWTEVHCMYRGCCKGRNWRIHKA